MLSVRTLMSLVVMFAFSLCAPRATRAQGAPASELRPPKSESHALKLSLLGTGVPIVAGTAIALLGVRHHTYPDPYSGTTYETTDRWGLGIGIAAASAGVILGPTLGYLYVGKVGGLPIRLLLPAAGAAVGVVSAIHCNGGEDCGLDALVIGMGVGTAITLLDTGYDLARIKSVVRKKNERTQHAGLYLVPSYLKSTEQPALALQVRF